MPEGTTVKHIFELKILLPETSLQDWNFWYEDAVAGAEGGSSKGVQSTGSRGCSAVVGKGEGDQDIILRGIQE